MQNTDESQVTLVKNAIHNPEDERHFMVIKPLPYTVTAMMASQPLAGANRTAVRVQEVGHDVYDPVVYFATTDVDMSVLQPNDKTTRCPLKGITRYFDYVVEGTVVAANIAWSYVHVYDFDDRIERLKDRIAFDSTQVDIFEYTAG